MLKKLLSKSKKVGGDIKYFGLTDWWLNDLTEDDRITIRYIYKPFGMVANQCIDEGKSGNINEIIPDTHMKDKCKTKFSFISTLITWFEKPEYYNIAQKIINLAEQNLHTNKRILDEHFYYSHCIKVYYRNRNNDPEALHKAIEYCKKQISISKECKMAFENNETFGFLPAHIGYKQLAIIYEKQNEYQKALDLSKQALAEGWNDEWEKRIDKLEKKLLKIR